MTFLDEISNYDYDEVLARIEAKSAGDVERALAAERLRPEDLMALLSPAAEPYLETMAQRAHRLTVQRFGRTILLYAPIYLSNECTNGCRYCVNSHTAAVRKLGLSVEALGEVLAIVGLFNTTNALADGYQVEPDVLPPLE